MKKTFWALCVVGFLLFSCAGTQSSDDTPILTLDDVIEQSAMKITAELPKGNRVAIVAFESPNGNLSDYIMEELTSVLFDVGLEVAARQNLEYVYKELNFQMSGNVSDQTAKSIGKFLGARMVITGELVDLRNTYRYRTSAIHVEKATRASVTRLTVRNDAETRSMINALADYKPVVRTAGYGASVDKTLRTAGSFFDQGLLFANRGDWDTAIADFTEAIRLDANYTSAYYNRGFMYHVQGDYDKAIADYTNAIRLNPDNAAMYSTRGRVYNYKGNYDQVIADLTKGIRLDPNNSSTYNNRDFSYYMKGNCDQAIENFTQVLRIDPNNATARESLNNARRARGR